MSGWKTWAAAILYIVYGGLVYVGVLEPNPLIEDGIKSLALIGIGHKLDKARLLL